MKTKIELLEVELPEEASLVSGAGVFFYTVPPNQLHCSVVMAPGIPREASRAMMDMLRRIVANSTIGL